MVVVARSVPNASTNCTLSVVCYSLMLGFTSTNDETIIFNRVSTKMGSTEEEV